MTTDRHARVLVLDDDAFMLSLLGQMLARLDYKDVTTFTRGADAVTALKRAPEAFDLILCDLQMPQMDGVEFVRHLVESRYTGALVLVSGEDSRILEAAETLAKAHSLQVLGTLRKPPDPGRSPRSWRALALNALGGHRHLPDAVLAVRPAGGTVGPGILLPTTSQR